MKRPLTLASSHFRNGVIGLIAAAILLIVFFVLLFSRPNGFDSVPAEIIRIESVYDGGGEYSMKSFVAYVYKGVNYESALDTYMGNHHVGMKLDVLVNPNNPLDVRLPGTEWMTYLLLGLAILALAFGVISFVFYIREKKGLLRR